MMKSKTELALQELNQEIQMIVKSDAENDTSYFPDAGKVLESFDNYLISLGIQKDVGRFNHILEDKIFVFQQNISLRFLIKFPRFISLIHEWEFIFQDSFKGIFSYRNYFIDKKHFLPQVNMNEVIFLIYLCIQVERKQILGKLETQSSKNLFLLKQIIKILDEFYSNDNNDKSQFQKSKQINEKHNFSINQDKFVKILLLKALKIKLQNQNYSFCQGDHQKKPPKKQKVQEENDKKVNKNLTQSNIIKIDENFSIISVQSEYNPSIVVERKNERIKQSLIKMEEKMNEKDYELQMKNLSSQEIFNYIQLNELRGYITE